MFLKTFVLYVLKMVSKYLAEVLEVLNEEIQSTNEILRILEEKHKRFLSWHVIYRCLRDLKDQGKVELLNSKGGMYWRKK